VTKPDGAPAADTVMSTTYDGHHSPTESTRFRTRTRMSACTAPSPDAASVALDELDEKWCKRYGRRFDCGANAWDEFVPFLDYDIEIQKMNCSPIRSNH
jgi:transposase-like protein